MPLDVPAMQPKVLADNQRTNEWIRRLVIAMSVLVLVLGGITAAGTAWLAMQSLDAAEQSKAQAERNEALLRIVVAVTGCSVVGSPTECKAAVTAQNVAEGGRRLAEVDCIVRRAAAGLPPVVPPLTCAAQTPPDIYPGVTLMAEGHGWPYSGGRR